MGKLRFAGALAAGKLAASFCRAFFPKRGSNLPGAIALKIDPLFLRRIKGVRPDRTVFITGTNGKSTANNMIVHAFKTAGHGICSNLEGANMKPGIASALLKNVDMGGNFKQGYLILEVDERSLAQTAGDLPPGHICVTNVQTDQVQRNGDPDYIYQKIKAVTGGIDGLSLYVNNDEPRSRSLGSFVKEGSKVFSFGVEQNTRSYRAEADWRVSMPCPICGDALVFTHFNLAGVGAFYCPACGFGADGDPDVQVTGVDYENESFSISGGSFRLAYPAAFFLYNYALCACVCSSLGLDAKDMKEAFSTFVNLGGRMEELRYKGKHVRYMRIKQENPETLQNALDTIADDKNEKVFVVGPAVVDDIIPHYSNTFYTFACNFEPLIDSSVEHYICFGDTISWDMANRLRYAGVPYDRIEIVDTDDDGKILAAIASCKSDRVYLITWIKKFEKLKSLAGASEVRG